MITLLTSLFGQVQQRTNCASDKAGSKCLSVLPEVTANEEQLKNGLTIVFGVLGALAVLVIVLGAINYITADGNPEGISKAKKTIIYALIGLMIALSAEVLVLTLIGKVSS
ncbi:MAG: pilin [Candidatus Saccharimonadales bacterium]